MKRKKAEVNENWGLYLCRPCVLAEALPSLPFSFLASNSMRDFLRWIDDRL